MINTFRIIFLFWGLSFGLVMNASARDQKLSQLLSQMQTGTVSQFAEKLQRVKINKRSLAERRDLIFAAIDQQQTPWIKELIRQGLKPNEAFPTTLDHETLLMTPLLYAVSSRSPSHVVEALLDAGADASLSQEGILPLNFALSLGQYDTARLLLKRGAKADAADSITAMTPLMELVLSTSQSSNRQAVYRLMDELIEKGADINARNKRQSTALSWAALQMDQELVAALIQRGAKPNLADVDGTTPLHIAARKGDSATMSLLLKAGANACLKNQKGLMPQDLLKRPEQDPMYVQLSKACRP